MHAPPSAAEVALKPNLTLWLRVSIKRKSCWTPRPFHIGDDAQSRGMRWHRLRGSGSEVRASRSDEDSAESSDGKVWQAVVQLPQDLDLDSVLLSPEELQRLDDEPDDMFYANPCFSQHVDDGFLSRLESTPCNLFASLDHCVVPILVLDVREPMPLRTTACNEPRPI